MGLGHKLFVIVSALLLAGCTRKPAPSLFESNLATEVFQQLTAKLPRPVRVLQIDITPDSVSIQVQDPATPTHVDEHRWGRSETFSRRPFVSGPHPVSLNLINPKLEENLFNLDDVNIAAIPGTVQEAIKQTALEGGGAVERIEIKRRVGILPVPKSGDVEWAISVRSSRETASAYADSRGHINRLDLAGTERAKNLDFTEGGVFLDQAMALIRESFGGDKPVFLRISIGHDRIWFVLRPLEPPHKLKKQICDLNGLHDDAYGDLQDMIQPGIKELIAKLKREDVILEPQCFTLDEIDWSKLPDLRKAAIQKMGGEAEVNEINLRRRLGYASPLPVQWEFTTQRQFNKGYVHYDTKGNLLRFQPPYPPTTVPNQLEPANARVILNAMREDFGPQTRLIAIGLKKQQATVIAPPPGQPGKAWDYVYYLRDGMKLWSDMAASRPDNDAQMIYVDEVLKMVDTLDDLKQKALAQAEGEIESVDFYRYWPGVSSKLLLIRFSVSKGIANSVNVTFDSTGRLVR